MISKKLIQHLEQNKVKYEIIKHRTVYTSHDVAATLHLKLKEIAKNLLVKTNKPFIVGAKPYAIVLVSAEMRVDLKKLVKVVNQWTIKMNQEAITEAQKGVKVKKYDKIAKVVIPAEKVMKTVFKVEPGKMHAFGSLYKLPIFVDKSLLKVKEVVFSASSFEESIKMKVSDFLKMENAVPGSFSIVKKYAIHHTP